jgi:hypothetical protein
VAEDLPCPVQVQVIQVEQIQEEVEEVEAGTQEQVARVLSSSHILKAKRLLDTNERTLQNCPKSHQP